MKNHCQSAPLRFLLVILIWVQSFTLNESATCNGIPQVPHAKIKLKGQTPPFQLGTNIAFECEHGYVTDLTLLEITCHEDINGDAVWNELPFACKAKNCGFPGDVPNARRIGHVFTFSNNVTYICNEGFKLRGPGTIYCMTSGIWRPALPSCKESSTTPKSVRSDTTPEELKCSTPGPLENGKFQIEEGSEVPHLLIYRCNDGSRGKIKCLTDGTWNKRPKCLGTTMRHSSDDITKTHLTLKEVSSTSPQITDVTTKNLDDQKDAATSSDYHNGVSTTHLEPYKVTTTNQEHHSVTTTNQEHYNVTTTNQEHHSVTTTNQEHHSVTTTNQEHHSVTTTNQDSKKVPQNEVESTTGNGSGLTNAPNLLCLSFSWLVYYFAKLLFNHFCENPLHYSRKSKLQ